MANEQNLGYLVTVQLLLLDEVNIGAFDDQLFDQAFVEQSTDEVVDFVDVQLEKAQLSEIRWEDAFGIVEKQSAQTRHLTIADGQRFDARPDRWEETSKEIEIIRVGDDRREMNMTNEIRDGSIET